MMQKLRTMLMGTVSLFVIALYVMPGAFAMAQEPNFGYFTTTGTGLLPQFGALVSSAIPVFIALAFFVFLWGLIVFISASGSDAAKESGKNKMIWGVLAIFVIVSIWGILSIMRDLTGTTKNDKLMPASWY